MSSIDSAGEGDDARRDVEKFVYEACDQLDDMEPYREMRASLRQVRYGISQHVMYASGIIAFFLGTRLLIGTVIGRWVGPLSIGFFLLALVLSLTIKIVVPRVRSRRDRKQREFEIVRDCARQVAGRLRESSPDSKLLAAWQGRL